jgi:hypothetical protein
MSDFAEDAATQAPVIETVPIIDTFCSGVSKIETIGHGLVRLYLYAVQGSDCGEGPIERTLVAKLILPAAAVSDLILKARTIGGTKTGPSMGATVN